MLSVSGSKEMTELRKETKPFQQNTSTVNKETKFMMYHFYIGKDEWKRTIIPNIGNNSTSNEHTKMRYFDCWRCPI